MPNIRRQRAQDGQALVEFALTLPILLLLVLGIIDLARIMFAYSQTADAARQAIRYGIVEGLEATRDQYFDCEGIRDAALKLPGIVSLDPTVVIEYEYTNAEGDQVEPCAPGITRETFSNADAEMEEVVLRVEVKADVTPLTPAILPITGTIPVSYTVRRTIVIGGADYTHEWLTTPDAPQNFTAVVDCGRSGNNVSFFWTPISPIPAKLEIRNTVPPKTLVDEPDVRYAYCIDCAAISPTNGFGSFNMVTFVGKYPLQLASEASEASTVLCPSSIVGTGPGTISGVVWNDYLPDTQGTFDEGEGEGINGVSVYVVNVGADGQPGTADDTIAGITATAASGTGATGVFNFGGLDVPGSYYVQVAETSVPLDGFTPTAPNPPQESVTLSNDTPVSSVNFGFVASAG